MKPMKRHPTTPDRKFAAGLRENWLVQNGHVLTHGNRKDRRALESKARVPHRPLEEWLRLGLTLRD